MVSATRKKKQGGQEILEFALVGLLLVPLLLGSTITGLALVRSIQCKQICRDLTDMYIHGADFSSYQYQNLARRLAQGLNLQIGGAFTGNQRANTGNSGDGIVTVSRILYVGALTDNNCVAVGANNCVNHDSFVFTQRVQFGNGALLTESPASMGNPTTSSISNSGIIQNPVTDGGARVPEPGQSSLRQLWQVSGSGRSPLVDNQAFYVVETYFHNPITLGSYPGIGVSARYFF